MVGLASTVCETGAREALVAVLVAGGQLRLMKCYPTAREDQRETQDREGHFGGKPGAPGQRTLAAQKQNPAGWGQPAALV